MSRRGFTLVESVVMGTLVVAVLAVAPASLRRVRGDANLTACLDNLRAIGAASLTYAADDPTEQFIPVPALEALDLGSGAFEWGGKAGRGQPAVPGDIASSRFGTGAFRGPAHRPLNSYLYPGGFTDWNPVGGTPNPGPDNINYINDANLDLGYFRCPSDTGYAGGGFLATSTSNPNRDERAFRDEGLTAYDHYGTSYAASMLYITGGLAGAQLRSQSLYLTRLSRIVDPAHTLAYQEVPSRQLWLWGSWEGSGCDFYQDRVEGAFSIVPGWHGIPFHFNATFADGHATTIEIKGCIRPAPNLGTLTYPPNRCGEGISPYVCARCITFRGPGWQLDSLPAEEVPTQWYSERSSSSQTEVLP